MKRASGFTLIELLITLVIAGIVISVGMPAFGRYRNSLVLRQANSQLMQDIRRARQAAVTRRAPVVIKFGAPPVYKNVTTYEIHVDTNGNNAYNNGEPRTLRTLPRSTKLDSVCMVSQLDTLTFDISGTLRLGTQGGTLYFSNQLGKRDTLMISGAGICYRP